MLQQMSMNNLDMGSRPLTPEEELAKKKLEEQQAGQKTGSMITSMTDNLPTEINNSAKYQKMMQLIQPSQQNQVDALTQQRQKTLQRLLGA